MKSTYEINFFASWNEVMKTNTAFSFQIFYPETTDVYDRKNMPKVIYCIHALRYCRWIFFSYRILSAETTIPT